MDISACGTLEHGSVVCFRPNAPPCCFISADSDQIRNVAFALYLTLACSGGVFNFLTLTALPYARSKCTDQRSPLKSSLTLLIIHLAFWDFIYCMVFIPFAGLEIRNRGSTFGPAICYAVAVGRHLPMNLSFCSITAIALNRCLAVWYPQLSRKVFDTGKTVPVIIFMWILVISLLIPTLFPGLEIGIFGYNYYVFICDAVPSDNGKLNFHYHAVAVMHFIFLLTAVCSGMLIYLKVRRSSTLFRNMSNVASETLLHFQRRERSISFLVISVAALYTICIIPFLLQYLGLYKLERKLSVGILILRFLYQFNFVGNFFIYILGSSCYRDAFLIFLKRVSSIVCCGSGKGRKKSDAASLSLERTHL